MCVLPIMISCTACEYLHHCSMTIEVSVLALSGNYVALLQEDTALEMRYTGDVYTDTYTVFPQIVRARSTNFTVCIMRGQFEGTVE